MRSIRIGAELRGEWGAQQASLQVALHVTKRQNGGTASDRGYVGGGGEALSYSQEALSIEASGSDLDGRFGEFDAGPLA